MARTPISDHLIQFWTGLEASFGAGPEDLPDETHAIEHIAVDLPQPFRRTVQTEDASGNRGFRPPTKGALDPMVLRYQWPMRGPGASGSLEIDALMRAGGFERDNQGGAIIYRRSLAQADSAWLWGAASDGSVGVMYAGLVQTDGSIPDIGTDNARMECGLQAARGATVYATELQGQSLEPGETSIMLPPGHGWVIAGCPALIEVIDGDTREVMRVLGLQQDVPPQVRGRVFRVQRPSSVSEPIAIGAQVRAYVPPRDVPALPPIGEIGGGFTVDDGGGPEGRQFTAASLAWQTGVDLLEKPALEEFRDGLYMQKYGDDGVTLDLDVTYTIGSDGIAYLHAHCDQGTHLEVACTIGTRSGNRVKVTIPTALVDSLDAPTSGDGPRRGTINIRGYSDDGQDIEFRWD